MDHPAGRILHFSRFFYFDESSGAAIANRGLMEGMARLGWAGAALSGTITDGARLADPGEHLRARGIAARRGEDGRLALETTHLGVHVTIAPGPLRPYVDPDAAEGAETLRLVEQAFDRVRPDVLLAYGGDPLTLEVLDRARRRGIATVFTLHNFAYARPDAPARADRVLVASAFSGRYHEEALGLPCQVLPYLVDASRVRAASATAHFLTFVNPSIEKGVHPFARIADELGRRRPDIPILVVESRGTEATVASCGLELRGHGTVHFMAHTPDPRDFWGVTKVCLLPSVWWENQPLVAVEAMANGIPVVGSDRGGIPETLGDAGIVLPLPDRITQATRILPTADEVRPWVEAIIRLWDDSVFYEEHRRRALAEARRWDAAVVGPQYDEFFRTIKPKSGREPVIPAGRSRAVVLVPHLNGIAPECDDSLRRLEASGVRVVRSGTHPELDVARSWLASEALHDGFDSIFFIDANLGFDPLDVLRLLARPEPVIAGVYGRGRGLGLASVFAAGVADVTFGTHAFGLYPLRYAAAGFLRIDGAILRRMARALDLPLCDLHHGRGVWPFFQPIIAPGEAGRSRYLDGDRAFGDRLARIGVTPMADTSIRLWAYGRDVLGWEGAMVEVERSAAFAHRV